MAIHVTDKADFQAKLTEAGGKLVIVDFFAEWCGPCKNIAPKLEEYANENASSVVVLKVNVEECEDVAEEYEISSMPTFVFIKEGKQLEKFSGANYDRLKSTAEKHK